MTLILRSATRTRAPVSNGISPPFSIKRPALISRSEILATASISAGVGPFIVWAEVMIYMKRMQNSCWGELRPLGRQIWLAIGDDERAGGRSTGIRENLLQPRGNNIPDRFA